MIFLFKFSIYFVVSFIILSFPLNKKPIFEYAHEWSKPITLQIYDHIKNQSKSILKSTIEFSKNIFKNSTPRELDKVRSGFSGVKKDSIRKIYKAKSKPFIHVKEKKPFDSYTPEEKNILNDILKDSKNKVSF